VVSVEFDEVVDASYFSSSRIRLYDNVLRRNIATEILRSEDGRTVTLVPAEELAVGRSYRAYFNVRDYAGNTNPYISYAFTTRFVPDGESPVVENISIVDGLDNVPTNAVMQVEFSEPVNSLKLGGIGVYRGAEALVLQSRTLSSNRKVVTLKLSQLLEAQTSYTIRVEGVEDLAGNVLSGQVSSAFVTGAGTDLVNPTRTEVTPLSGSTIATDGKLAIRYSERLTPLTVSGQVGSYRLYNTTTRQYEPVVASLSADGTYVELTATEGLQPDSYYYFYEDEFSGSSDASLQVIEQAIGDGLTDVALNNELWLYFGSQLDSVCVNTDTVVLRETDSGTLVSGSVEMSSNRTSLRFVPDSLSSETSYTLELDGVCDVSGNVLSGYSTSYVTGTEASDTTGPRVSSVDPASNTVDVATDTTVMVTFTEAIRATDLDNVEIRVDGSRVAGSYGGSADQTQVVFTPDQALPSNTEIEVYISRNSYYDLAGNRGGSTWRTYFTTIDANADVTAPEVVSITPNDNAVDISIRSEVVLAFSESLDAQTINSGNFALFGNGSRLSVTVNRSGDNRTVTLSSDLPANSLISVVVTDDVEDLSGNALSDYVALFSTGSDVDTGRPSITGFKPGNGASGVATDSSIILYSNEPLNEASLNSEGAFYVSQNGQLISGMLSLSGDGQVITYTPDALFQRNSLIEVFANSLVEDISGNALNGYQASFRVVEDTTAKAPTVTAMTPREELPLNVVFDFRFSEAIDPASITSENIVLYESYSTGPVPVQLMLSTDGRLLRVVPDGLLNENVSRYRLLVTVTDLDGESYSNWWYYYLAADAAEDTVLPSVSLLVPESGRQNVGINARIVGGFDEDINPLTLNATDIVPDRTGSLSIGSDNRSFIFTPHTPLSPLSDVTATLSGVEDLAGNSIIESSTTFTTLSGLDQSRPEIIAQSPAAVVSVEFDEVVDASYFSSSRIRLYDNVLRTNVAAEILRSEDGRTVTLAPAEELALGRSYRAYFNVRDYAGNTNPYISFQFTTSAAPDVQLPVVENISVVDGLVGVPTNAVLHVEFSEPVNILKLDGVGLFQGSEAVALQSRTLSSNRELVTLKLSQLLEAQTTYTIQIEGVEDLAGNVLSGPVSSTFVTGAGTDLVNPARTEVIPANGVTIPLDGELSIRYSERLTPLTVSGQVEPDSYYYFYEDEFKDLANNRVNGGSSLYRYFYTEPADSN